MRKLTFSLFLLMSSFSFSQKVIVKNSLQIEHGDIKLYLDDDTCTMVSKHTISWKEFQKIGTYSRSEKWFDDKYTGKYLKKYYIKSGFDKGHLTPSHITTYDSLLNIKSFSMFNAAPQYKYFNQQSWQELESDVEDTIARYKLNATIITGVIYNEKDKKYLTKGRIKIPTHYFKILYIGKKSWVWIGENVEDKDKCLVKSITLTELNLIIKKNSMRLIIK